MKLVYVTVIPVTCCLAVHKTLKTLVDRLIKDILNVECVSIYKTFFM